MTLLAIDWNSVAVKTGQFILSFSILVILHELGHFLPARWFKCRVEKFYLFFNPWFSLFKKKVGDTEYGLGWIPFGGYVKIAGMIDESMDKEQMKLPAQPWEFRSKPAWQRLIIMLGGVTVNVLLAIVIFMMILWVWGEELVPPRSLKYGIVADSLGRQVGLKDGDLVLKVGDKEVKNAINIPSDVTLGGGNSITISRDGREMQLPVADSLIKALNKNKLDKFVRIRVPFFVSDFVKLSNAKTAGIQKGDQIVAVDGVPTPFYNDFQDAVKGKAGKTLTLKVIRNQRDTLLLPVPLNADGKIGVVAEGDLKKLGFTIETREYSFLQSIPAGFSLCWQTLGRYIAGIKQLFNGKASPNDSLGSVISIGSIFPGVWDWQSFWRLTAVFSIILAFMNVLPIPALDGGHALFTLAEMITGRKPSDKFIEYAQMAGMVLLLGLMAYALGLDILRLFR
ncbi:MAG TPA: RIP metalloprotease RseP [Chitinophagaceae bacterium]|nr:RIP metalloprotease RseP [Chitinophagaceae bacterium]